MMHADFHYRDKIAVAVIGQTTAMHRQLERELAVHPWFFLAKGDEPVCLAIDFSGHSKATPRIVEGAGQVIVPELNFQQLAASPLVIGLPAAPSAALAIALQPLQKAFGVKAVRAVVMSGPGLGSNNAGPNLALGVRMEQELRQVISLSSAVSCSLDAMSLALSQQTVQCVAVTLEQSATCEALTKVWEEERNALFSLGLPSALERVLLVHEGPPNAFGQSPSLQVQISRIQDCPIFGFKFVVTSNARRVGVLLLAELLVKTGKVYW